MNSCEPYRQAISLSLDGMLSREEEDALRAHLEQCPDCRADYALLQAASEALREEGETQAPPQLLPQVMDEIRRQSPPKVIPLWRRPQIRALGALAACAVLCIGLYRFPFGQDGSSSTGSNAGVGVVPSTYGATSQDVGIAPRMETTTRLVLTQLPQAAADLLPPLEEWEQADEGIVWCSISSQQLEQLLQALEESGVHVDAPPQPWSDTCQILLQPEK